MRYQGDSMKFVFMLFLSVAISGFVPVAAKSPPSRAGMEVVALEKSWAECFLTGNPDLAKQFIADDFVGISSKGVQYTKAEALKKITESKGVFSSFVAKDITVRVYGNTVVAQGTDAWQPADKSKSGGSSRWTDTWIRIGGKWQIVAAQDTLALSLSSQDDP